MVESPEYEIEGSVVWVTVRVPLSLNDPGRRADWVDRVHTKMMSADQGEVVARMLLGLDELHEKLRDGNAEVKRPVYLHAHAVRWVLEQIFDVYSRAVQNKKS